ncbi:ABC transporter substrate-binding protein [Diplocloster hominis]|uniref:ABC transporter substrate-binding protein n=1 Tax=Diplocloster hominis TaxID=3079010 RepID=UPI0031BB3831
MKKKLVSLMLVSVMALSLVACGSKEEGSTPAEDSKPAADDAAADASDADADADAAPAAGENTFVIGGLGPLTGSAASYGNSVKQGAEIAIKEINDAGGVKVGDTTYQFALNFKDDEASEETVVPAYQSLMDDGINALLGTVTSGAGLAITDLTYQDGILQITPSGSAIACIENDNAFRICFTDPLQGQAMADFMIDKKGLKKIAVIYNTSDEYSTGIKDKFEEVVAEKGGEIVASEAFQTNDVDFSAQLTKIKATDAEAIFVPAYYNDAAYITAQANDMGMSLPFFGSDGWDGVLAAVTDPAFVEGAIFLSPFLASDDSAKAFTTAYEAAYSATPDQFAADGYDAVYVMKAAMEKAGSIENADLIAAMDGLTVDGLTGAMTFDKSGEPNKGAKFIEIKEGQYAYTAD